MTVTNDQELDDVFRAHDKEKRLEEQQSQSQTAAQINAQAEWLAFRNNFMRSGSQNFQQHVVAREGQADVIADTPNSCGIVLYKLSGEAVAGGVTLMFKLHKAQATFTAQIMTDDKRGRYEVVSPEQASPSWLNRWFGFLLEDFRKAAD